MASARTVRSSSDIEEKSMIWERMSVGSRSIHKTLSRSICEVEPSAARTVEWFFSSKKASEGRWSPSGSLRRSRIFWDFSSGEG